MSNIFKFTIDYIVDSDKSITKISNDTEYDCTILIKPIPPKRKYLDLITIKKGTFFIIEEVINLKDIFITFQ